MKLYQVPAGTFFHLVNERLSLSGCVLKKIFNQPEGCTVVVCNTGREVDIPNEHVLTDALCCYVPDPQQKLVILNN